ncbi:hypothetical protein RHSIM_RhsimUnG0106900 [Rhododendron simsii]|uniref:Uncharacterized protein n=1 Tax=Rhododendron simsii TaxID=118357 RepID=A0A834L521_RHOSS|nr:hypothetical protein RHSIM_RhsimUnG0106900 [Rhododendron simsii]
MTVVVVHFLVAVILAAAIAGCPLPQGTDASDGVLIPDSQSSIPSDVQTTLSSVTVDGAPLGDVDPDGEDDDPCGCYGSTATGICPDDYVAGFPPHHVDVQIDACPCPCPSLTIGITTEIRMEEWVEEDDDDVNDEKFGNSFVGLTFEDAVALMSSFLNTMARVAIVFDLTVSVIGWMLLRIGQPRAANYLRRDAGLFSVAVAFFSMTSKFIPDYLAWAVWAAAGALALGFAYSIAFG